MPLPRLELETSGFDTMLGFMHQPDEPKSLSYWEEVGNSLILHNNYDCYFQLGQSSGTLVDFALHQWLNDFKCSLLIVKETCKTCYFFPGNQLFSCLIHKLRLFYVSLMTCSLCFFFSSPQLFSCLIHKLLCFTSFFISSFLYHVWCDTVVD